MIFKKIAAVIIVLFSTTFLFTFVVYKLSSEKSYIQLEDKYIAKEMERLSTTLDDFINYNVEYVELWSYWDGTLDYVNGTNDEYIEKYYSAEDMEYNYLNFAAIYDDEKVYFKRALNLETLEFFDFPDEVINLLRDSEEKLMIIEHGDETFVFSKGLVGSTDKETVTDATLVYGFRFSKFFMDDLEKYVFSDIEMKKNFSTEESFILKNKDTIEFGKTIKYNNSNNTTSFVIEAQRDILSTGRKSIMQRMIIYACVAFSLVVTLLLATKYFLKRLEILAVDVENVDLDFSENMKVEVKGNDEISVVGHKVNSLLEKITELHDKLLIAANIDPLTGALSRKKGIEKLQNYIDLSDENNLDLTVVFVDLNDLKVVNDTYGHNLGDQYIKNVTDVFRNKIRKDDFIVRLGGDEFLIVFCSSDKKIAKNILSRIEEELTTKSNDLKYKMVISYGIEKYEKGMNTSVLIELADKKMYADKKRKRNKKD